MLDMLGRHFLAVRADAAFMAAAARMETRRHACAPADMEVRFDCAVEKQSYATLHDGDCIFFACSLGGSGSPDCAWKLEA